MAGPLTNCITEAAVSVAVVGPLLMRGMASAQTEVRSSNQAGNAAAGYQAAMEKMNRGMAAMHPSGNADRDFAAMMILHHQAGADMARVELEQGRDPEMRWSAQQTIEEQQREIAELRQWLSHQTAR